MSSISVKQVVSKILREKVRRYEPEQFQVHLIKLSHNKSIQTFAKDLYNDREELQLFSTDLRDILQAMAQHQKLLQMFGNDLLKLWLEFEIIAFFKLKERLEDTELDNFPYLEKEQLQLFKQISKKYLRSYAEGSDAKLLESISKKSIYQELKKTVKNQPKGLAISRMAQSKFVPVTDLTITDYRKLSLRLLSKISEKANAVGKQNDQKYIHSQLKEMLDLIMENGEDIEKELLKKTFQQVIFRLLHIKVQKNSCEIIEEKTKQCLKESYRNFRIFSNLQHSIAGLDQMKDNLLDEVQYALKDTDTVWYWPCVNGDSLIAFLRNQCITDKRKMQDLVLLMNTHPPKLKERIYNLKRKEFLHQALQSILEGNQQQTFVNCLTQLAKHQQIDVKRPLQNSSNYEEMFGEKGVPGATLAQLRSNTQNCPFCIFDLRLKKVVRIQLTTQHMAELKENITNSRNYQRKQMDNSEYCLSYQITSQKMWGWYKKVEQKEAFEGCLLVTNILEYGQKLEQGSWGIVGLDGTLVAITQSESESIGDQIAKLKKKQDQNNFSVKISSLQNIVEINLQTLKVEAFSKSSAFASRIKSQHGYLLFIPSFKKSSSQAQFQIEQPLDYPANNADTAYKLAQSGAEVKDQSEQNEGKVENQVRIFKWLGYFKDYFEPISGYSITKENHVEVHKISVIEYFQKWQATDFYQLISGNLLDKNSKMPQGNVSRMFRVDSKVESFLAKRLKEIHQKAKIQLYYDYILKQQILHLKNMKPQRQANWFFTVFFEYFACLFNDQNSKKSYVFEFDKQELKFINQRQRNDQNQEILVMRQEKNKVQISCNKQVKQKLLAQIKALDQIHSFIFQNVGAFELMKESEKEFLEDIGLRELERQENTFKVQFPMKYLPSFKDKFRFACEMFQARPGETRQLPIPKEGPYLQLYRAKLASIDPEIAVIKMGEDLLVQYNSKLEKLVSKAFEQIRQDKEKEVFEILSTKSDNYEFKNVEPQFIYSFKKKVNGLFHQKAPLGSKAHLNIDLARNGIYLLQAIQTTKQELNILKSQISLFHASLKQFKKCKSQIYDTKQHFNKAINKIPFHEKYGQKIKALNVQLRAKLVEELTEVMGKVTAESYKQLEAEFLLYLQKDSLESSFEPKSVKQNQTNLIAQIAGVRIFEKFINAKIQDFQKQSSVKNAALKLTIINQLSQIQDQLQSGYSAGTLQPCQMKRFFKSLNILLTIYYGQQLPITSHLQSFRQKLQQSDVVMVKVGTGSGKSTVIPPYLVGVGHQKVVVTQPRRLPCRQIYKRVTEVFGEGISGYQVADNSKDKGNSLVYKTDGLLKMQAIFREEVFDEMDVLVIDEIHERSANIDVLLLLLAEYYSKQPRRLKLLLCSATINDEIGKLFSSIGLKVDTFEVKTQLHKVEEVAITEGTIIQKVLELSKKLNSSEQMLVFIPGEAEVEMTVRILSEKFNKLAYALTARVAEKQQESMLQNGQIFISTSIAETSLTFRNLKYVIDSRLSRWRKFNPKIELMETEESYSSNSSIHQRRGRLGRTCPGQYHHLQYHDKDFQQNREHNPTELEKINLTNLVFQLLLTQGRTFQDVKLLLGKLKMKGSELQEKLEYSRGILQGLMILNKEGSLRANVQKVLQFGNLGNPQHNVALHNALENNCLINMIYLVAFQMYGTAVAASMIEYCRSLSKDGGDIRAIHDFLVAVGRKIAIEALPDKQIPHELKTNCKQLTQKAWFNVLAKIMVKAKQLMSASSSTLVASGSEWNKVLRIMTAAYQNKVFFNQSLFGGDKKQYEKVRGDLLLSYDEERPAEQSAIHYILNFSSSYSRENLPSAVISFNCEINAMSECILSVCEELQLKEISHRKEIAFRIIAGDCRKDCFNKEPLDERKIFDEIYAQLRNKFSKVAASYNYPTMELKGSFADLAEAVQTVIERKRRNGELKMSLKHFLESAIKSKEAADKWNKMASVIDPEHSRMLFEKLNFNDYKRLFDAVRYEMKNKFAVDLEWDLKEKALKVTNAKNFQLNKLVTKVASFFKWFCDCQIISQEEFKIKPQYIGDGHPAKDTRSKLARVMDRVNQLVDSKLEHYVLKGWVSGRGGTKYPRTARMIAVCWVLINVFGCTVKGGFVRDWVVNGEQWVPATAQERAKLLQPNPRNQYKEVLDDKVTPNDIDAELPETIDFDANRFRKEMKKLGIAVDIKEDGWRKHVSFDELSESGGFTADLIEPYTCLTHYTYDFDVNVMYVRKDNINAIGMKIPLVYEDVFNSTIKKVGINELIELNMKKQMKTLKADIPHYRFAKFQSKGWKIDPKGVTQPICYKSQFTQSFIEPLQNLQKISPTFYKMVNDKHLTVIKIEQLRNKGWDDAFEASQNWIINQLQRFQKKNNPNNYDLKKINSNNKVLFHGTRSLEGAKGIKQSGFDSRYFNATGLYGKGAYFADDSNKSHDYTAGPIRYMFLVNVALGRQEILKAIDNKRLGPGKDYHSILGQHSNCSEYIIDRWGQAKPLYLITYK